MLGEFTGFLGSKRSISNETSMKQFLPFDILLTDLYLAQNSPLMPMARSPRPVSYSLVGSGNMSAPIHSELYAHREGAVFITKCVSVPFVFAMYLEM